MTNVIAEEIRIKNCTFEYIRSSVASFNGANNVVFCHNSVKNTNGDELFFGGGCDNARITNNVFDNCGYGLRQTFCVRCVEAGYYIANNVFKDFGCSAIGVGVWCGNIKTFESKGIIENNEICFSPQYFAERLKYTLMDSGAIYLFTKNDNVIIRNNYIHDYAGAGDNRGIFCDDGAFNIEITGNVITGIENSYCIDSRRCSNVEEKNKAGTGIERSNINIIIKDNIVDGPIRFEGNEKEDNGCIMGTNYFVTSDPKKIPEVEIQNVSVQGENTIIQMQYSDSRKNRLCVSKKDYRMLKKSPEWRNLKKYVVKGTCNNNN